MGLTSPATAVESATGVSADSEPVKERVFTLTAVYPSAVSLSPTASLAQHPANRPSLLGKRPASQPSAAPKHGASLLSLYPVSGTSAWASTIGDKPPFSNGPACSVQLRPYSNGGPCQGGFRGVSPGPSGSHSLPAPRVQPPLDVRPCIQDPDRAAHCRRVRGRPHAGPFLSPPHGRTGQMPACHPWVKFPKKTGKFG